MEKDEERNLTASATKDKEQLSSSNDDSKDLDFAADTQTGLGIAKQVDVSENQRDSKDSIIQFASSSRTVLSDESIEIISEGSSSPEYVANTRRHLGIAKETDVSEKTKTAQHSTTPLDSSSSTSDSNESFQVIPDSSSLLEYPVFNEPNVKMSDVSRLTSVASKETSCHPSHEEQSQHVEIQRLNVEESASFMTETSKGATSLEFEQMGTNRVCIITRCKTAGSSVHMKQEFVPDSSDTLVERNEDIEQTIPDSTHCKKYMEKPESSAGPHTAVEAVITKSSHKLCGQESQHVENKEAKPVGEIITIETRAEETKLSESIYDKNIELSAGGTDFVSDLATVIDKGTEHKNNKLENLKQENLDIENAQQSEIEIPEEIILEKFEKASEKNGASGTGSISDITKQTVQKPETLSKRAQEEPRSLSSLLESSDQEKTKKVKLRETVQVVTSDGGTYYEVFNAEISDNHIADLLKRMKNNHYPANGAECDLLIHGYCKYLFEKDYKIKVVNNEKGTLCKNYPARILVPYAMCIPTLEPRVLEEVTIKCSGATCRDRFIAPTIFLEGGIISRSTPLMVKESVDGAKNSTTKEVEGDPGYFKRILIPVWITSESYLGETSRTAEVRLRDLNKRRRRDQNDGEKSLDYSQVLNITNLVKEYNEKKMWISLNDAETVYQDGNQFRLLRKSFPDAKFFRRYEESKKVPDGLLFDYSPTEDLIDITQNDLKEILTHFILKKTPIVIHCITGWDQTPLLIALLRISLWADGIVHASLTPHEMAYLTLAYDWYLFGHNLPLRLKYGESILHFCYKFLESFLGDEYSEKYIRREASLTKSYGPFERTTDRIYKLCRIKEIVLELYKKHVC